jgi:signal transduction histidine kinase
VRLLRPPGTLRGRLVGSMLGVFALALAASTALDALGPIPLPHHPARESEQLLAVLDHEPYQDALVLAGASLPALLLIWLVSNWSLRPLARASHEARALSPANPAARISRAELPAEIAPLVEAVNGALDRMAEAFEAERRFTENAAHELRTPLAVLGLRLQCARDAHAAGTNAIDWAAIDTDLGRMNRLVHQLLDLASKEHAGRAATSAAWPVVNLSRIAREACAMILPLAEASGRTLAIDLPETMPVRGRADDLRDAVRNIMENALLHGSGTVGVTGQLTNEARLIVTDEGPGVPPEQQDAVFERFSKSNESAGNGLGLAIVRQVVRSHGGDVAFVPGGTCRIAIALPAE